MDNINFSKIRFKEDSLNQTNSIIAIRIKDNRNGSIRHTPISIDRCCRTFMVKPNISSIKDEIPRAPCNMSKEDFYLKYVQKRKSVILRGCQKSWRARKWTLEGILLLVDVYLTFQSYYHVSIFCNGSYLYLGLLRRYPTELNITWNTVGKDPITNERFLRRCRGDDILSLLKKNYSLKIFERLNTGLKRQGLSKRMMLKLKMDIFKDYSFPQPFPADKFLRLPNGSPDQAYLILGTIATGK